MLTTLMREAFGYDEFGNAPHLTAPIDAEAIFQGRFTRVAGEAECPCGVLYRQHPQVQGCLWLHRACDGLVKL